MKEEVKATHFAPKIARRQWGEEATQAARAREHRCSLTHSLDSCRKSRDLRLGPSQNVRRPVHAAIGPSCVLLLVVVPGGRLAPKQPVRPNQGPAFRSERRVDAQISRLFCVRYSVAQVLLIGSTPATGQSVPGEASHAVGGLRSCRRSRRGARDFESGKCPPSRGWWWTGARRGKKAFKDATRTSFRFMGKCTFCYMGAGAQSAAMQHPSAGEPKPTLHATVPCLISLASIDGNDGREQVNGPVILACGRQCTFIGESGLDTLPRNCPCAKHH